MLGSGSGRILGPRYASGDRQGRLLTQLQPRVAAPVRVWVSSHILCPLLCRASGFSVVMLYVGRPQHTSTSHCSLLPLHYHRRARAFCRHGERRNSAATSCRVQPAFIAPAAYTTLLQLLNALESIH